MPPLFPSRLDVGDSCVPLFRTVTKSVLQTKGKGPPDRRGRERRGEGTLGSDLPAAEMRKERASARKESGEEGVTFGVEGIC